MLKIHNTMSEASLEDHKSFPSSYKVDIKHGYIYLLKDSVFPEYVKLGMTRDLQRRYKEYNAHKPYNTAEYIAISEPFDDVTQVERRILEVLVKKIQPIGAKQEWFEVKHLDTIMDVVNEAESHFHLYIPAGDIYDTNR